MARSSSRGAGQRRREEARPHTSTPSIWRAASATCLAFAVACGGNASSPSDVGTSGGTANTGGTGSSVRTDYSGTPGYAGTTSYSGTGFSANSNPDPEPVGPVYLRLRNDSRVSFDTIIVAVEKRIDFGALAVGAVSEYARADGIYSYAYVDGASGADHYLIQPIDYVGENPLSAGYYTYALSVSAPARGGDSGSLSLRLLTDPPPP